jgi:hypothetical protein
VAVQIITLWPLRFFFTLTVVGSLALLMTLLSGCGKRSLETLPPLSTAVPGTHKVELLVATTRAPDPPETPQFGNQRGRGLSFAAMTVSIPSDSNRKVGEVQLPVSSSVDPSKEFALLKAERVNLDQVRAEVTAAHQSKILLYVDGYDTTLIESVFRVAQVVEDSGAQVLPVLFSFPSRVGWFDYSYDRDSATYSRDALEAVLQGFSGQGSVKEITIITRSLGNWLTLEALRQYAIRKNGLSSKITTVILIDPSIDIDVARRELAELNSSSGQTRYIVVASTKGRALFSIRAPDWILEPYKTMIERMRVEILVADTLYPTDSKDGSINSIIVAAALNNGNSYPMEELLSANVGDITKYLLIIVSDSARNTWLFLKDPTNLSVLVTLCGGAWAAITFFVARRDKRAVSKNSSEDAKLGTDRTGDGAPG